MPKTGSLDPNTLHRRFGQQNNSYKGLTWELEDLVGKPLMSLFLEDYPFLPAPGFWRSAVS